MSVETFTKKYSTDRPMGRRAVKMCGGFQFTEHEANEYMLEDTLWNLKDELLNQIKEAIKELHKITGG